MKRAIVTGSLGFVGRHIGAELIARGYEVDGSDLKNGTDCLDVFSEYSARHRYDLVVHCAAHVGGRKAIDGLNTNLMLNVQLDSALFDWAVRTKQKRVLYFSSSAVYPVTYQTREAAENSAHDGTELRLREDQAGNFSHQWQGTPDAAYGWAKLIGERMAQQAQDCGVPVTVVRPFSGYGEDQDPAEYPFPAIVERARKGDLTVWGPAGQCRDWIHIDDVVKGALAVAESGYPYPVNLCTGDATAMGDLAELVYQMVSGYTHQEASDGHTAVTYDEAQPTGVFHRVGDPSLMGQFYTPFVTLEEGIRRALAK